MDLSNGVILYEGPSEIDGAPIVVIAVGIIRPSRNDKTGAIVQIHIIRSDVHPYAATLSGEDYSICGNCKHRGKAVYDPKKRKMRMMGRTCYVITMNGPHMVFLSYKKGDYRKATPKQAAKILKGLDVRVGAYGDPGAVPYRVWEETLIHTNELTAYTHMWRDKPELAAFCMASCDTPEEREEAKALGFRVYRVRREGDPVLKGEGQCPASEEMGKAVQCKACMLCNGQLTGIKSDLTIVVHGTGAGHFNNRQMDLPLEAA